MKRVQVNPGEWFAISDRVILVREYESVIGMLSKLGTVENDHLAYLLTFTGKLNNREEQASVTLAMSPADVNQLLGNLLNGLELLVGRRGRTGGPEQ